MGNCTSGRHVEAVNASITHTSTQQVPPNHMHQSTHNTMKSDKQGTTTSTTMKTYTNTTKEITSGIASLEMSSNAVMNPGVANAPHFIIVMEGSEDSNNPKNQWTRVKAIGQGGYGSVFLVKNGLGEERAVKTITVSGEDEKSLQKNYKALKRELVALKKLGEHSNIVEHYKAIADGNKIHIFMEYCKGGSLRSLYLEKNGPLSLRDGAKYTRDVLNALSFLHASNMIHRDVKAANILLDTTTNNAKLADFGAAVMVGDVSRMTCIGTVHWMAPEILDMKGHRWQADIWSLGCTTLELLSGAPPFVHISRQPPLVARFILYEFDFAKAIPPSVTDPQAIDFIRQCLQLDREKRPTAAELLKHPFVVNAV